MPAPVRPITDPLDITLSPPITGQRVEVFERADSAHLTAVVWLARWPVLDSFSGRTTTLSLEVPAGTTLEACDGLTGNPVALSVSYDGARAELSNFRVMDYPIYLDIDLSTGVMDTKAGFHVY